MTDPRRRYQRWRYELWTTGDAETAAPLVTADFVGRWWAETWWRFQGAYAGGLPGATGPTGTPITLPGADLLRSDALER